MDGQISRFEAICNLRSGAVFSMLDDVLDWQDELQVEPTDSEISAELSRFETVYGSEEYARQRKAAYNLLDQDEMRYDDLVNGTTTWPDAIAAIKQEFPK